MFCRLAGPIPAVLRTQTRNKTQQRINVEILLLKRSSAMTVYSVKCNIVNIHVHESHIFFNLIILEVKNLIFKKIGKLKTYFLSKSTSYSCTNGGP